MLILLYFTNIPTSTTLFYRIKREKGFYVNNGEKRTKGKNKKIYFIYKVGDVDGLANPLKIVLKISPTSFFHVGGGCPKVKILKYWRIFEMLGLDSTTDITTTEVDYYPMETFFLHHVMSPLVVEFFLDSKFRFTEQFLTFLSNRSGLSDKMVWSIANNIRKPEYAESLKTLNEMIIDQVYITDRDDILDDEFAEQVERLIINSKSKHNAPARKIADAAWALVERIFSDNGGDLKSDIWLKKCQVKKVVVNILVVVMIVYLKHHKRQTFVG